eukprot:923157-Rhodomonas_salina.1
MPAIRRLQLRCAHMLSPLPRNVAVQVSTRNRLQLGAHRREKLAVLPAEVCHVPHAVPQLPKHTQTGTDCTLSESGMKRETHARVCACVHASCAHACAWRVHTARSNTIPALAVWGSQFRSVEVAGLTEPKGKAL